MERNSLGRGIQGAPSALAQRKTAGSAAGQDNVRANADTQRDGTPTNLHTAPTNAKGFFKPVKDYASSGMEKAMANSANKTHKR